MGTRDCPPTWGATSMGHQCDCQDGQTEQPLVGGGGGGSGNTASPKVRAVSPEEDSLSEVHLDGATVLHISHRHPAGEHRADRK